MAYYIVKPIRKGSLLKENDIYEIEDKHYDGRIGYKIRVHVKQKKSVPLWYPSRHYWAYHYRNFVLFDQEEFFGNL